MSSSPTPDESCTSLNMQVVKHMRSMTRDLPPAIRHKISMHVIDALAIGVAAKSSPIATQALQGMQAACGLNGPAQTLGADRLPPLGAAFVNASLIHLLDYDDIHDRGRLHPGAAILPAVMAAADCVDAPEERVAQALAMGTELVCRLAVARAPEGQGPGADWFLTQLFGYLGAALAAAHTLGLSDQECASALGLAYMQAAGGKQAGFGTGSNARAIYPAFAAQGGVAAAFLARSGINGPPGALDGDADLFRIYLGGPLTPEQRSLLLDAGHWHLTDVDIKPWPSCRLSHPYVAVALLAREAIGQHPDAAIRLSVNASAARLCRPLKQRRVPETLQDAKYSIPFMTAFALVRGAPSLLTLDDTAMSDKEVLAMAQRIDIDQNLPDNPGHPRAVLRIEPENGTALVYTFDEKLLESGQSMLQRKFNDCFSYVDMTNRAAQVWDSAVNGQLRQAMRLSCAPGA